MNIGHSSRLPYDRCAYPDKLQQETDPLSYALNVNQIYNCKRCTSTNGAGPRASTLGFGDSTLINTTYAPVNDLVDIDSIMSNRNVATSKCKKGKVNHVNLTKFKNHDYKSCDSFTTPEFTQLSYPRSNYRDMAVNRFYNLTNDPQEVIYYPSYTNTRLEAKDNFKPEIPVPFSQTAVRPEEYK